MFDEEAWVIVANSGWYIRETGHPYTSRLFEATLYPSKAVADAVIRDKGMLWCQPRQITPVVGFREFLKTIFSFYHLPRPHRVNVPYGQAVPVDRPEATAHGLRLYAVLGDHTYEFVEVLVMQTYAQGACRVLHVEPRSPGETCVATVDRAYRKVTEELDRVRDYWQSVGVDQNVDDQQ